MTKLAAGRDPKILVTPLLERELPASPSMEQVERWRERACLTGARPSALGGFLASFEGLSIEHAGVRATVRWLGSTVLAGEKGVFALIELSTDEARAAVLVLERGHDRALGVPVATDAKARIEGLLRENIEVYTADEPLREDCFFGLAAEVLQELPRRLAAPAPAESLGRWVLDHGLDEVLGEVCDCPLADGHRLTVRARRVESTLQPAKDGVWFAPVVEVHRTGAKGKRLGEAEQQVHLGFLGIDAMYEPVPDAARRGAAIEALRGWKTELAASIARLSSRKTRSLMPMDLPWPTPPVELAVEALRHGVTHKPVSPGASTP